MFMQEQIVMHPEKTEIFSDKWIPNMKIIFDAYKETNFHWVSPTQTTHFQKNGIGVKMLVN